MRILHVPANTAGQPGVYARAQRALGAVAESWQFGEGSFGFEADRTIDVSARDASALWEVFTDALSRFDVFHLHFGRSFFPSWTNLPPLWDLPLLRMLGKKVFATFHGSDCRMRSVAPATPWRDGFFDAIGADDDRTAKTIQIIRTYATAMTVVSPELRAYVPEATIVQRALELDRYPSVAPRARSRPVVVHAPSDRGTKGTAQILAVLRTLEEEGVGFDLHLLEGVTHDDAKAAIADADVVIDQVLIGDYGMVSIEAMASSATAVAYVNADVREAYPDLPVYPATPDDLLERLRALLTAAETRVDHAARGRAFVEAHHDAAAIGEELLALYAADGKPVPVRAFPDWAGFGDARKVETLEARIGTLEQALARLVAREETLRARLPQETPATKPAPARRLFGKGR